MKKAFKVLAFVLSLCLSFAFVGCGDNLSTGGGQSSVESESNSSKNEEENNPESDNPTDKETEVLLDQLKKLIQEKRSLSLNYNKTTEELYAGWKDD